MGIKSIALVALTLVLSTNVNAVVLNTLNGVDYEWLELTETQGLSRDAVELRLADVNDVFYGYEYASRQLVSDLFSSYTIYDGVTGNHGDTNVVGGLDSMLTDFGRTFSSGVLQSPSAITNTVDVGGVFYVVQYHELYGLYGESDECDEVDPNRTCRANVKVWYHFDGTPLVAEIHDNQGFYPDIMSVNTSANDASNEIFGSMLVRASIVPVPAAVWLFGSGLIGLIGVARRK